MRDFIVWSSSDGSRATAESVQAEWSIVAAVEWCTRQAIGKSLASMKELQSISVEDEHGVVTEHLVFADFTIRFHAGEAEET